MDWHQISVLQSKKKIRTRQTGRVLDFEKDRRLHKHHPEELSKKASLHVIRWERSLSHANAFKVALMQHEDCVCWAGACSTHDSKQGKALLYSNQASCTSGCVANRLFQKNGSIKHPVEALCYVLKRRLTWKENGKCYFPEQCRSRKDSNHIISVYIKIRSPVEKCSV